MRELAVSICVIKQGDAYVLQKRGDDPRIGAAGLVGAFGGKIEKNETAIEAVIREVQEETNLTLEPDEVHSAGEYTVLSDNNLEQVIGKISVFTYTIDSQTTVEANEGFVVTYRQDDIRKNLDAMTPATKAYFENNMKEDY